MPLQYLHLSRLERNSHNGDISVTSRSECNAVDGPAYSLFEQAKSALNRSAGKQFGFFNADSEHRQLAGLINNWLAQALDFAGFASRSAQLLEQQLLPTEEPFSALLLTASETLAGRHYLYWLWLPEQDIMQTGSDLAPYSARMIAADKLQYALRLCVDEWQDSDSPKYLCCYASRGNKAFSEAFGRFGNFSEGLDTGEQTRAFLELVDDYSRQLPQEQAQPAKSLILDYCIEQDRIGQPVSLETLSGQLSSEQPAEFARYVRQHQQQPLEEIHTHRPSLKRYMRFFGRDDSLSISFSAERIGRDIVYDTASGALHIQQLPASLKTQLRDAAQKK